MVGPQNEVARDVILRRADRLGVPVFAFGQDFVARQEHGRMVYEDESGLLDLPLPRLVGRHQIENAGVAIAALRHAGRGWGEDAAVERALPPWNGRRGCSACRKGPWSSPRPRAPKSGWMAATIRMAPKRCRAPWPTWRSMASGRSI